MTLMKSMLYATVVGILIILIVMVADVIVSSIHVATDYVAVAFHTEPVTSHETQATNALFPVFFIGALVVVAVLLVYNIHVKKR